MSNWGEADKRYAAGPTRPLLAALCGAATLLWLALGSAAAFAGLWKLLILSLLAAGAFIGGGMAMFPNRSTRRARLADALASGAMLAGALVIVIPEALHGHLAGGALGIVAGLIIGAMLHYGAHGHTWQTTLVALCLHSLAAGLMLGLIYARLPTLGIAVGLAVIAHKLPAGYLLGAQLDKAGQNRYPVLLPGIAVGLAALPAAFSGLETTLVVGPAIGLAGGLFLFVSLLFTARLVHQNTRSGFEWGAAFIGGMLVAGVAIIGYVSR